MNVLRAKLYFVTTGGLGKFRKQTGKYLKSHIAMFWNNGLVFFENDLRSILCLNENAPLINTQHIDSS